MNEFVKQLVSLLDLLRRSLGDPVSVGTRAWAAALGFVVLDALTLQFLVLDNPDLLDAVTLAAIAALGYLVAGVWLLLGRVAMLRLPGRWWVSVVAWTLVGLTWGGAVVMWDRASQPELSTVDVLGAAPMVATAAAMSVIFACFAAIVLHAHRLAKAARAEAMAAYARYRSVSEQMAVVQMKARLSFRDWLEDVLQPAIAECTQLAQRSAHDAAVRTDSVREQVVRVASRRLHPRTVALGPRLALGSVMLAHGLSDDVEVHLDQDPPDDVTACLARCLDVMLTSHRGDPIRVVVDRSATHARMQVLGIADSALANGPEVLSRVHNLDGSADVTPAGVDITMPVIRPLGAVGEGSATVHASDIDVPVLVGIALTVLTGIVIALLDNHWLAVLAGSAAALIGSMGLRMIPITRVLTGSTIAQRIGGAAWLIGAAGGISTLVTAAWWWSPGVLLSGASAIVFWCANTFVVAAFIVIVMLIAERIDTWQREVDSALQASAAASLAARTSIRDVDRFREEIASTLHSHVQARLIVACGRLEHPRGPDVDGALRALTMIEQVDIPQLRHMTDEHTARPHSLTALVGAFDDVQVQLQIDETFAPGDNGPVVEVVREAIVNAVRHGGASHVRVNVHTQGRDWLITVADDGLGPSSQAIGGLGLVLVDAASRGRWELATDVGGGARLIARVGK